MALAKLVTLRQLEILGDQMRRRGRAVVWTSGCFDLLHLGHVRSLQAARKLGDVLVVGLNSDASVRRLKGPGRPIFPAEQRAELLAALACVDHVVIFDELMPERALSLVRPHIHCKMNPDDLLKMLRIALSLVRPHIHCKGADYGPGSGRDVPEAKLVESFGGKVVYLPLVPELSTSELIRRIREGAG